MTNEAWSCAARSKCASKGVATRQWVGPFCVRDHRRIAAAIADLPLLRLTIDLQIGHTERGDGGYPTVESPAPIRLDLDAVRTDMNLAVETWYDVITAEKRLESLVWHKTFADKINVIKHNLVDLYRVAEMPVQRWVPERYVPTLPDDTVGRVTASGDAIVIRDMSGADGALEMLTLATRACKLLDINPAR